MSPRTCSHIKANGTKCGSPALKYNTLCYFHYQWKYRRSHRNYSDMKEGWTTLTLPPLETKASIIFAISEIQAALLDGTIDSKMARTLLYAVQLAIQVKATEDELASTTPDSCLELRLQHQEERRNHRRPPQPVCDSCEQAVTCTSSEDCIHSTEQIREFEKIHEPERYAQQHAVEEEGLRRWNKAVAESEARKAELKRTDPAMYQQLHGFLEKEKTSTPTATTAPAPNPTTTPSPTSTPNPCHGERRMRQTCASVAEPPFVSPTEAQLPASASLSNESTTLPREDSLARDRGSDDLTLRVAPMRDDRCPIANSSTPPLTSRASKRVRSMKSIF